MTIHRNQDALVYNITNEALFAAECRLIRRVDAVSVVFYKGQNKAELVESVYASLDSESRITGTPDGGCIYVVGGLVYNIGPDGNERIGYGFEDEG